MNVPVARNNAAAIASALDTTRPDGATPTAQTLEAARATLVRRATRPPRPRSIRWRARGATGDSAHRAIEDQAGLIAAFQQITGGAASCDYLLAKPVSDKRFVRVTVDGKQLAADDANGWVLSADMKKIHLQGSACSGLRSPRTCSMSASSASRLPRRCSRHPNFG